MQNTTQDRAIRELRDTVAEAIWAKGYKTTTTLTINRRVTELSNAINNNNVPTPLLITSILEIQEFWNNIQQKVNNTQKPLAFIDLSKV